MDMEQQHTQGGNHNLRHNKRPRLDPNGRCNPEQTGGGGGANDDTTTTAESVAVNAATTTAIAVVGPERSTPSLDLPSDVVEYMIRNLVPPVPTFATNGELCEATDDYIFNINEPEKRLHWWYTIDQWNVSQVRDFSSLFSLCRDNFLQAFK